MKPVVGVLGHVVEWAEEKINGMASYDECEREFKDISKKMKEVSDRRSEYVLKISRNAINQNQLKVAVVFGHEHINYISKRLELDGSGFSVFNPGESDLPADAAMEIIKDF